MPILPRPRTPMPFRASPKTPAFPGASAVPVTPNCLEENPLTPSPSSPEPLTPAPPSPAPSATIPLIGSAAPDIPSSGLTVNITPRSMLRFPTNLVLELATWFSASSFRNSAIIAPVSVPPFVLGGVARDCFSQWLVAGHGKYRLEARSADYPEHIQNS